jgi:predicted site-specific integrase-resolvase
MEIFPTSPIVRAPSRAAQYVRMSTEHQQYSPQNQLDVIRQYAADHNMDIVQAYSDHGRSGLNIAGREGLNQLMSDVEAKPIFDRLRPFVAHTQAMNELLEALNDATAIADPVQNKVRTLLFDGSGNRNVFDEHIDRLKERAKDLQYTGQSVPAHLTQQLTYCDAVTRSLTA